MDDQGWAIFEERTGELQRLGSAFDAGDNKSKQQWIAECAAIIKIQFDTLETLQEKVRCLTAFGATMWQHGYESAPSLTFLLPEGTVG